MKVRETMTRDVVSVSQDDSLAEAYDLMTTYEIHHLPVVDDKILVGVLSDRDILVRSSLVEGEVIVPESAVGEAMQSEVVTCKVGSTVAEAATIMLENKINCLPVVSGEELVGMITTSDLVDLLCGRDEPSSRQIIPINFVIRRLSDQGRTTSLHA